MTQSLHTGPSEAVRHGGSRRTKNLQGERVRKGREEGKKEKGEKREERKGEESKRSYEKKMYYAYGCKTPPWNCQIL